MLSVNRMCCGDREWCPFSVRIAEFTKTEVDYEIKTVNWQECSRVYCLMPEDVHELTLSCFLVVIRTGTAASWTTTEKITRVGIDLS